jgi:hypothetical protein
MLTIICPYRGRDKFFQDFIHSYSNLYPDADIYMMEQVDNEPFKRGQLANVAFNEMCKRGRRIEAILFADVDLRLFGRLDLEGILKRNRTITVPFDSIELRDFAGVGNYKLCPKKSYFLKGHKVSGGLTLYSREMFEKCCGFSNVYIGWGCEDSDFLLRTDSFVHECNTIFHLEHVREGRNHSYINRNAAILENGRTDFRVDGYEQTIVRRIEEIQLSTHVYHYRVDGITVPSDFQYMSLLKEA